MSLEHDVTQINEIRVRVGMPCKTCGKPWQECKCNEAGNIFKPASSSDIKSREKERNKEHDAAKKKLLAEPNMCPFCGSVDTESGDTQSEVWNKYEYVACSRCQKRWYEIYTLSDIEIVD